MKDQMIRWKVETTNGTEIVLSQYMKYGDMPVIAFFNKTENDSMEKIVALYNVERVIKVSKAE